MKHINHLFSLFLAITLSVSTWGNEVTVDGATGTTSTYLPVALTTTTSNANFAFHSVSQQLYYASELAGASSTKITAISFDYVGTTMTDRKIAVWLNGVDFDSFPLPNEEDLSDEANKTPNMVNPGTKVFSGTVAMVDGASYTITFTTPYVWNGTSNIIVTVLDSTAKKNSKTYYPDATIYTASVRIFETSGKVRFLNKTSKDQSDYANKGWDMNNLTAAKANTSTVVNRKYANRITFTFAAAAVPPATPSDLAASNVGSTSASLSWSAVDGATSYKLYHSTTADGVYSELASPATNSYNWSGLTASTTYFVKVAASNAIDDSELSEPISFTTLAPHIHDGITFEPWSNPSAMPTSGNYYLANDVTLDPFEPTTITLTGDLNLCLNGNTANVYGTKIVVPDDITLSIYDNVGGGKITGFVASEVGSNEDDNNALIVVKLSGTLVLKEGAIENNYIPDEDGSSYAIYSNGTLRMAGAPSISSKAVDIYLSAAGVITLDGALTNSEKYSIKKYSGTIITTGWGTHMSGEKPRDFFVSADDSHSVSLNEGEAVLITAFTLADNVDNSSTMSSKFGLTSNIIIGRSFSSASYNTICLPFDLSNAQLQDVFGASYDLQEFVGSSINGETLELSFSNRTALVAGKPYVIQPASNVSNPTFEGVRITATSPASPLDDDNILFKGVLVPTSLTGGNMKQLFLGANNELFYPSSTDNLKSFRAYFEIKADVALSPGRIRMAFNSEKAPQGMESVQDSAVRIQKVIRDGKLIIIRDGREYNAQGILIR